MTFGWLDRRLWIGRYAGIDLYLHWSLLLIIGFVISQQAGESYTLIGLALLQLVGMFTCVTLHEYGHAMAARRYNIGTADITLLAIGGLARLQRMPRIPLQELIVAVAGPAVNVVIATAIVSGLYFYDPPVFTQLSQIIAGAIPGTDVDGLAAGQNAMVALFEMTLDPSPTGYLLVLLLVNLALVLFNFVPAFPMDGGRVLRSILAMIMDYRRATFVASRLGWVMAAGMVLVALSTNPPSWVMLGVAFFIVFAGGAEARHVQMTETVRGITAADAMIPMTEGLSINANVQQIADYWRARPYSRVPVVGVNNIAVGSLGLADFARFIASPAAEDPSITAGELVQRDDGDPGPIRSDEWLQDVLPTLSPGYRLLPVTNEAGSLIGLLDLDNAPSRRVLASTYQSDPKTESFDVLT